MNKLFISLSLLLTAAAFGSEATSSTSAPVVQKKIMVTSDGQRIPINGEQLEQLRSHMLTGLMFLGEMGTKYPELAKQYYEQIESHKATPEQAAEFWHALRPVFDEWQLDSDKSDPTGNTTWMPLLNIDGQTLNQLLELAGPEEHTKEVLTSWAPQTCLLTYAPLCLAIEYLDINSKIRDVIINDMAQRLSLVHTLNTGNNSNFITFLKPYAQQNLFTNSIFKNSGIKSTIAFTLLCLGVRPQIDTLPAELVKPFKFSPDGHQLALATHNHGLQLYQHDTTIQTLSTSIMENIFQFSFSPDGTHLAVTTRDMHLRLYDIPYGTTYSFLIDHFMCAEFSPDSTHLAFKTDNDHGNHLYLHNIASGQTSPSLMNNIEGFSFSPDSTHLALRTDDRHGGHLYLHNIASGQTSQSLINNVIDFSFSPDGTLLAVATYPNRSLHLYDIAHKQISPALVTNYQHFSFSPNGKQLAFTTFDGHPLYLYDITKKTTSTHFIDNIGYFQFSPNSTHLAFNTDSNHGCQLYLYDTTTKKPPVFIMDHAFGYFSQSGYQLVFTAGLHHDDRLHIYDTITQTISAPIINHVNLFQCAPDGTIIVDTSDRQTSSYGIIITDSNRYLQAIKIDKLNHIQQLFMLYVLGNEHAGHPVTFTHTEIEELDVQSRMSCESHRPLLDLPPDLLEHVHIVG